MFRYNYFPSGITFQPFEALDIRFDPALYGTLSNGVAGAGFTPILLQPNNPPGAFGDYIAEALVNNPSLAGPFSVDLIFKGTGTPDGQPFTIDQYDQNGNFVSNVTSGQTTPVGGTVPEPGSFSLGFGALGIGSAGWIVRRRSRRIFSKPE